MEAVALWFSMQDKKKKNPAAFPASTVVTGTVLCYHLLSGKMEDIQVIADTLPPSKVREKELHLKLLLWPCLDMSLHKKSTFPLAQNRFLFLLPSNMGPQHCGSTYARDDSSRRLIKTWRFLSKRSNKPRSNYFCVTCLQQENKRCVSLMFFFFSPTAMNHKACTSEESQVPSINRKCRLGKVLVIKTVSTPAQTVKPLMTWKGLVLMS